jgi:hypothetical protein
VHDILTSYKGCSNKRWDTTEEKYLLKKCIEALSEVKKLHGKPHSWRHGKALIFESEQWGPAQKLVLLLLLNGEYRVQFEVSRENNAMREKAKLFAKRDFNSGWYLSGDFNSIEEATPKFQETAEQLTKWKEVCGS